ncbi:hypothetical protein BZG36_04396 [Bifiguratus adelaidae]|uniref:dynamin GTPase n=1 Tax=Bifiguratus adelaidae TaxID=1938954 RepID=A0A261XVR1_9FUNG|nr:hypothetical protein BZG36_04396 [Bifiguratus adelaidae]
MSAILRASGHQVSRYARQGISHTLLPGPVASQITLPARVGSPRGLHTRKPLRQHVRRITPTIVRSYRYVPSRRIALLSPGFMQTTARPQLAPLTFLPGSERGMAWGTIPRVLLKSLRIPLAAAGTAAGGAAYVNYKVTDYTTKSTDFINGITQDAKNFIGRIQEDIEDLDIHFPELPSIGMPEFVKNIMAGRQSTDIDKATKHTFGDDKMRGSMGQEPGGRGEGPNYGGGPAAAAAAAAAALLREEDEDTKPAETEAKATKALAGKKSTSILQHDEQFMMLTKKLIEIRSILLSIDHNDTLKLPSIVVIGSQSSGKSSVLEAIVGHEFLPKGSNMVTRRPIELTLIHTPGSDEEYGEFPSLPFGKIHDFKQIQKTLTDLNLAVPEDQCVSDKPIELKIYSPNIPDLQLIDLPGYIQIHNANQPASLKSKIEDLCEKYIKPPNIILAVCAADVDLANSPALNASRRVDPRGRRTIGVVTKMDLVEPELGAKILRNRDYPLQLGYIGVICKAPSNTADGNLTKTVVRNEDNFFKGHYVYNQRGINVGTVTLRRTLMSVLEQSMGRSLSGIVDAVQKELEEARYQFKVQYNDRRVSPESYLAETVDALKHRFKDFAGQFGKPQVRHEVRQMLEQRLLDICAEMYWSDRKVSDLPKALYDDIYWLYKLDLSASALTKSGVGRSTTQLVLDVLLNNMDILTSMEPLNYHPSTKEAIIDFSNEILRHKFLTTSDQVENTIKPYKYEVEVTEADWADGLKRTITLLERELAMCDKMSEQIKQQVGKKKLRSAIKYLLDLEKEEQRKAERISEVDAEPLESEEANDLDLNVVSRQSYPPKVLEKAQEALFLRDRSTILKYRLAALKSRQCKTADNKQYCPEAFLNVVAEKLTYTAVMFIQVELLNEFFFQFPREVDNKLVYQFDRQQINKFARENPSVQRHLDLQERKAKLEEVMEKLNYLVRRQQDRQERAGVHNAY